MCVGVCFGIVSNELNGLISVRMKAPKYCFYFICIDVTIKIKGGVGE